MEEDAYCFGGAFWALERVFFYLFFICFFFVILSRWGRKMPTVSEGLSGH